jgi:hypothetical protein
MRPVRAVAMGRVGTRAVIVAGSADRTVRVWDAATGQPVGAPFTGYAYWVWVVAIGQVGHSEVIFSGSAGPTILDTLDNVSAVALTGRHSPRVSPDRPVGVGPNQSATPTPRPAPGGARSENGGASSECYSHTGRQFRRGRRSLALSRRRGPIRV